MTTPATPESPPTTAPEIFISYAREDRADAEWVESVLTSRGWSVWMDSRVLGGQSWMPEIKRGLDAARCVVVLWSKTSTQSNWVLDEAGEGMRRSILCPLRIDEVEIPLGFKQVQTIDIPRGDRARDRAVNSLVSGVAHLLGRPRVEAPAPARWSPGRWIFPVAALVPLVIAAIAGSVRVPETDVDLDATATEAAYVSAKEGAVTELLLLSELDAGGLTSIQLPRTRESAERLVSTTGGRAVTIRVAPAAGLAGAVTLPPLVLAEGGSIAFDRGDPKRLRLSITASNLPITVNVQGTLQVTLPGEDPQLINFGAPKPIVLEPAQAGAELQIGIRDDSPRLLGANVPVNDLSFLRVNRTVETARNQMTTASTIVSARLRQDRLWRRERAVTAADQLRFGGIRGDVRAAELVDGGLRVQFHGTARRVDACGGAPCVTWMPTYLDSVAARHTGWILALGAGYLLYLALAGRRWIKSVR